MVVCLWRGVRWGMHIFGSGVEWSGVDGGVSFLKMGSGQV